MRSNYLKIQAVESPKMMMMMMMIWILILKDVGRVKGAVEGDDKTKLLNQGCSRYNAIDTSEFYSNLNATFSDLRAQLTTTTKHFATAQQVKGSDSVYALVQCRNYLSTPDCTACFAAAQSKIRNCSAANGARLIYQGCILSGFFEQTSVAGNTAICENQTLTSGATAFSATVEGLISDLQEATPKINGFFAASKREITATSNNNNINNNASSSAVYGVAQCVETVSKSGCEECLKVAYVNLQGCLPDSGGSSVDAGCFLRYSNTPFFADNQTTNLSPFLTNNGASTKNGAIIGGVVGGLAGLLLLLLGLFFWFKRSRKSEAVPRGKLVDKKTKGDSNILQLSSTGDILGATELQGPVNYSYKVLKYATKNYSEENKLGEGGFGDVYKYLVDDIMGYTAPEYAIHGQLSEKADTYSYGVVVLEIISGQKSNEIKADSGGEYLLERAWKLYEDEKQLELVDESLDENEYEAENMKKVIEIALMCTQSTPVQRPTMSEVVALLKSRSPLEQRPLTKPIFIDAKQRTRSDTSTSTASSNSNATVSISQVSGR
ncbi:hypothetical protein FEM48_Zijuj01G0002500 [Ziziphus jujuba var. spinosa]|uniref:Gnk2-homologous domain-containing protein n=1 Tax=Ziziphus jujuba var. spinosa TaxID=714518 RepID=A0A978VY12_ZIZJJ|nr:hypothetical protein FEM48_Zijuj01G0002500 [Ziziphus jujuba var. spinosa]